MFKNKIILYVLVALLFVSTLSAYAAQKWVSTRNTTPPIVFLDTNSIKRFNAGAVYNVRYVNKENNEILAQIYTDLKDNAAVLSASNYDKANKYDTFRIPSDVKMKTITSESSIYNSMLDVKEAVVNKKVKFCAPDKCTFVNSNEVIQNTSTYDSNSYSNNNSSNSQAFNEPDFEPYMRELQRRIKLNWDPPKGNEAKRVVVLFKIAKDGRLLSCNIKKSSGLPSADQAALKAVKLTAPFRPLPSNFKGSSVDIQFTFDYNVFNASRY